MSIQTVPAPSTKARVVPMQEAPTYYRFSVQQYHEMCKADILTTEDRVELLDGLVVNKMSKKPPHTVATVLTREALQRVLPPDWHISVQDPVTTDTSEPEPDCSLVRGNARQYLAAHPGPSDVGVAVEISESSLHHDRTWKKSIYARARIPVYWIVNLIDNQIEVYTDPTGPAGEPDYRRRREYGSADEIPVLLDGNEVGRLPVRELLP